MLFGWVYIGIMTLCIGASLGEICAVYPTSGGLYHWSFLLGGNKNGPFVSWITAHFNIVGQIACTASVVYANSVFLTKGLDTYLPGFENTLNITLSFYILIALFGVLNTFASGTLNLL